MKLELAVVLACTESGCQVKPIRNDTLIEARYSPLVKNRIRIQPNHLVAVDTSGDSPEIVWRWIRAALIEVDERAVAVVGDIHGERGEVTRAPDLPLELNPDDETWVCGTGRAYEVHDLIVDGKPAHPERLLEYTNFPSNDWRRIVVDSNRSSGGSGGSAGLEGINQLASVFEKLENLMKSNSADNSEVKNLLGQAIDNIDGSITSTREKLDSLSRQIHEEDTGTIGGQGKGMSRNELLSSIAEVAQELMQPLTAINASVEMLLHGYVGSITAEQTDLLTLASNSGEHLKFLMDMLIEIVGCPANKGVDNRFHTTSEQVQLMKDAEGQEHLPLNLL